MADPNPFLPLSQPNLDTNNHRKRKTRLLALISGVFLVLLVVGFVVFNSYDHGNDRLVSKSDHGQEPKNVKSENVRRFVSRGKSAGVSEKANDIFFLTNNKSNELLEVEGFPWTNDMLQFQKTAFHFQPDHNFQSDPSGPLYYKGWYHFFYQHNPNAAYWGDIVWGHAVSRDMIHWFLLPFAIVPDHWYDIGGCFTGSITILPDGKVIMLYTGAKSDLEQIQNLAYPEDENDPLLLKWKKYSGNPILVRPPFILPKDFRDPSTAWYTSEGKWRISIGTKVERRGVALIYETTDFINYELLPGYLHGVSGTGEWECIDFYPVSTVDDYGLDISFNGPNVKHVLKESGDDDRHDWYSIGTYDEKNVKWTPDNPDIDLGIGLRYDYGVFYASKSFYDPNKKRRLLWGYIHEGDSEAADVKKGWATVQSMPRTIVLDRKTGDHLLQWPVEEVESLRLRSQEFSNVEVKAGSVVPIDLEGASQLDIIAEFELDKNALESAAESNIKDISCSMNGEAARREALGPFGFMVLADKNLTERTPVYFYVVKGHNNTFKTLFCIDQTWSSMANDVNKLIYGDDVPVLDGEKFTMRILVDHSIIEGYAQGGRTCITSRVYPTKAIYGAAKLFLFNNAKDVSVTTTFKIWQMNSALIKPYSSA